MKLRLIRRSAAGLLLPGLLSGLLLSGAGARTVQIGGAAQAAAVDSKVLAGTEMLAVWTLPRLGISVRNDPRDTRLLYGSRELRYSPERGWVALGAGNPPPLPAPQSVNGSLYVPLAAVKWLGVRVWKETPSSIDFAAPAAVPSVTLGPSPEATPAGVTPARAVPVQPATGNTATEKPAAEKTASAKTTPTPARPATTTTSNSSTAAAPRPVATLPNPPVSSTTAAPVTNPVVKASVTPAPTATAPATATAQPSPAPTPVSPTPANPTPANPVPTAPTAPSAPLPTPQPAPAAPVPTVSQPAQPVASLNTVRVSRTMYRGVEVQRVVLELSAPVPHTIAREKDGLSVLLGGSSASAAQTTLSSGDSLTVTPGPNGATVALGTGGGSSEVFTLDNPYRVVIDTVTLLDGSVPPPINPEGLAEGVSYSHRGMLHLLSFDPALYQPRVVSALPGRSTDLATLVKSVRGVGGVNGGYFDTVSDFPVDLVVQGGLMTAPSLERRATVGFSASGEAMFGYPRPRYVLRGNFPSILVNTVGPKVRRDLLSAFVGDGRTAVGADGLTTLYVALNGSSVDRAITGRVVPPAGTLALTFDPQQFPQIPRAAGQALKVELVWRSKDAPWETAQDALSAGPLLVSGGRVALDPGRENFNTSASIWRATRQVAIGVLGGKPTIAYFEHGTPEAFATALAGAGFSAAVRLDSGSSASAYLSQGFGNLGGYLNTVWGQNVPNAIVFVPKTSPLGGKK